MKCVEAFPIPNEEAFTCMSALYDGFFAHFGLPLQLHSDQGRNFECRLVAELTKLAGIRRTRTMLFHPQSNGQTERMNKTLLQMLRVTAHTNPIDSPMKIPTFLAACRMTPTKSPKSYPTRQCWHGNLGAPVLSLPHIRRKVPALCCLSTKRSDKTCGQPMRK